MRSACVVYFNCSDQPMDGAGIFGGSGMFGGLGGQPSAAKASTNVFGAVSFGAGQQTTGSQPLFFLYMAYFRQAFTIR